ncbi:uncharacterized protein LOC123535019 [Mercenaria mercenaria]|uniref:uncharacterized protein LOC123535019 n=1 Tax=Mercenaria mercenaria TaxID=6596 RepID=UPI00234E6744|nr:uncharacterized protein LOC123535019 [Mercenaria mercenaria]
MCQELNASMVKIKTFGEMSLIRTILIHHYRNENGFYRPSLASEVFIGLRRYVDSSGVQREHWPDGTPLTFTAWDDNEPADTLLNQCTKMRFHTPGVSSTWKTQSCSLKVPSGIKMTAMCEQTMSGTNSILKELFLDTKDISDIFVGRRDAATMFKCSSGELTSAYAKCNGISECFDSSDEISCNRPDDGSCLEEEFTCPDGRCIHVSKVCDFVEDCVEAADEICVFPSCTDDQYKCASGQCIRKDERCDSVKNCLDASDETSCDVCDISKAFQCGDRSCISVRLVCDMHSDCPDGSDEMSCDREYKTCEDIWRSGITNSGYFHIGQSYYIYCDFDGFGKDGGWMKMQYLNTDWKQLAANRFRIETAGISNALHRGYRCNQKFSSLPHRERLKVMELDNKNFTFIEKEYEMYDSYEGNDEPTFSVRKNIYNNMFSSFLLEMSEDFDTSEDRMKLGIVECHKYISKQDVLRQPTIFCRHGVKSVNRSQQCLYHKDKNDVIDGCRSLSHLQNCENFSCPEDYAKCPGSFCIPLMYVCNGRIDCPDGYDEKVCACKNEQRKIIIMTPESNDGTRFLEIAARLGGLMFTEKSEVNVVKYKPIGTNFPANENSSFITLRISDILSNSEHYRKPFKSKDLTEQDIKYFLDNFYGDVNEHVTFGIILLTNENTQSSSESVIFSQIDQMEKGSLTAIFKYRVVINRNAKTETSYINKGSFKEINVRNADILGTIGTQLFPELCNGKIFATFPGVM